MHPPRSSRAIFRLFLAALTLCLLAGVFSFLSAGALAAIGRGNYGSIRWSLNTFSGELNISGSGAIPDFVNDEPAWMEYSDTITRVTIGAGITRIGDNAFSGGGKSCPSLSTLRLPTTLLSIGSHAFEGSGLESVSFPSRLKSVGSHAFAGTPLRTVEMSDSLTQLGEFAFAGSGLTMYRDFEMETDEEVTDEADYVDLSALVNRSNAL